MGKKKKVGECESVNRERADRTRDVKDCSENLKVGNAKRTVNFLGSRTGETTKRKFRCVKLPSIFKIEVIREQLS
jgi:hypothetical protein